jgi:hypothetical protein
MGWIVGEDGGPYPYAVVNWRQFLLRRLFGRLRITDDIVSHLTTFQRLGETLEVEPAGEMLPTGARTLFRAIRTRGAAQIKPEWLWPYWVERQLDPHSPAFIPRGHLPFLTNVTQRNWTMVGNLSSRWEGIVDPRGLVTPWFDGWSLDWWIGSAQRWHLPSREPAVRQSLLDSVPVVETIMRIPGGDAVQRVYAVLAEEELVVVEVENRSAVPVAVAFALRPYNPEGLAVVERIAVEGDTVLADGRPALILPRAPAAMAASTFARGDSVADVIEGRATPGPFPAVKDPAGLAQAAFVYPLPHRTNLRVAMPLVRERRTRRRGLARRRVAALPEVNLAHLPTPVDVARGWTAQLRRGLRLQLPDPRLQAAVDANRAYLLLFHDGDEITPGPFTYHRFWFRDAAYQLVALDRFGFHAEAAEVLRSYPRRQQADGFFLSQHREWDANGAAIWVIAEHHRLTGDGALLAELLPAVRKGARWIAHKKNETRRKAPEIRGLLPAGISAEHLGPFDYYYWDDFWSLRGLLDAAALLSGAGEREAAAEAEAAAAELRAAITASLELVAAGLGRVAMPAGPRRGLDAGMIGSLVACAPLGLLPPDDPWVTGTLDVIRDRFCLGDAFFQSISHTGLGTYLTLQLAFCELEGGDVRALRRLRWLLDAATTTFTWPEAIHPQLGGGCMGDGHHGWAAADFLSFVRQMLVRETADGSLALCTLFPPEWAGQDLEVHDAPTHQGRLSYALRWHGERPALLWECDRPGVRLVAPGLDPAWSTTERTGEALLGPYRGRVQVPVSDAADGGAGPG